MSNNNKFNSIRFKSSIPTVALAITMVIVLIVAYSMLKMQEQAIKLQAEKFLQAVSLTLNADRDLYQAKVAELNLLSGYGSAEKNEASRIENAQQVFDRYAKYAENMKDYPDVLAQSTSFRADFDAWKSQSDKVVAAMANATQNDIMALRKDGDKKFSALRDNLDKAGEAALAKSEQVQQQLNAQILLFKQVAVVVLGLILIIALAIGYIIPRNISRQLQKTINTANAIANGDLSNKIEVNSNDETGQLLHSMQRMQDNIQSLLQDSNKMSAKHNDGDIDVRIDEANFQGDFAKMAHAINSMVAEHVNMNRKAMAVFKAFGSGDFGADMEKLPGKKAFINDSIETVRDNLQAITADTSMLVAAVANGELDKTADASKFQGDWKVMIEGINQILSGIVQPLNEAISVLKEVEQGNLTRTVEGDYQGDLRDFKQAVNNTVIKLSSVISETMEVSQTVSQGAYEVAQGSMDLSKRVQEQASALEQTSATMEQMSASVRNNAEHAKEASQVVRAVQEKSNTGSTVMDQTIIAMNAIQESSHKISDIVTLIDGIAFQTNLLALNAAVEAARAGEHGRGFAVVAGEVRSLSQKSADAAKEINNLISESVTRIDQGTKLASESSEVLSGIKDAIDEVVEVVEQIAQASSQQMNGIGQVHKAISQMDGVTQQNAAQVEQTAAAADSMSQQAETLDRNMAFFQINRTSVGSMKPAALMIGTNAVSDHSDEDEKEY
ncbi:methyl-accepting chemotaxis protein [Thiomicrorhabdus sediminis]|uniref:HAMP domain-containing protein n=1 Tax=Thiomicrorhabdus sediminis TaxID=2580412 RepID=A0A4P9K6G5_9GAMM|nr:methyl-accepting chemotaxis protein [Thiomicrorhabdus sediminis]QCU90050.1 HAMP domain-containing protein [Thiomicrorhabdus sediminis]